MGKNFSCNQKRIKRNKSDYYQTPHCLTQTLLDCINIPKDKTILEPCAGENAIVNVLIKNNYSNITYYDINDYLNNDVKDFFDETKQYDYIITNPPYSLSFDFIKHGLSISDNVIYLLPLSYLHGKKRFDNIYNKGFLKSVYIFTRYPLLTNVINPDGKIKTGMMVYAWYWFSNSNILNPEINWIDINEFVL